jgi:hydroxyacyl-ACP dehydratase HTD2-like protein with hotdog domain
MQYTAYTTNNKAALPESHILICRFSQLVINAHELTYAIYERNHPEYYTLYSGPVRLLAIMAGPRPVACSQY